MKQPRQPRVQWVAVVMYAVWLLLALAGLAYLLAEVVAAHRSP